MKQQWITQGNVMNKIYIILNTNFVILLIDIIQFVKWHYDELFAKISAVLFLHFWKYIYYRVLIDFTAAIVVESNIVLYFLAIDHKSSLHS